jgi:hypothetical protein
VKIDALFAVSKAVAAVAAHLGQLLMVAGGIANPNSTNLDARAHLFCNPRSCGVARMS